MVTLLPLVRMLPVSVPLSVPPPEALLRVIVVLLVGLEGLPLASCDCTVTLNAVPAVPVLGTVTLNAVPAVPVLGTVVYTSFVTALTGC
jgi:hypothetical protein